MKYIILPMLFLSFSLSVLGQVGVGIRTNNPQGIFHIDGNGDNAMTPTESQLLNDVLIKTDGSGGIGVGIGAIPLNDSQLTLGASNKALTLNRVALTSDIDRTTIPTPQKGMFIYNTTTNTTLTEGIYYYSGDNWLRMDNSLSKGFVAQSVNLLVNTSTIAIAHNDILVGLWGGAKLKFTSATDGIKVSEKGSYAFALRLFGSVGKFTNLKSPSVVHYYVYAVRKSDGQILDSAELDVTTFAYKDQGYLVILGSSLNIGDEVVFYLAHHVSHSEAKWTLYDGSSTAMSANRTSMIYWKL